MKYLIPIACLLVALVFVGCEAQGKDPRKRSVDDEIDSEAQDGSKLVQKHKKRSIILASPVVAHALPVASVVHHNPTTVVKTEQVQSGDHSSYSYSTEVKSVPTTVVRTAVAAAPVVSTVHHTVPSYVYPHYSYPHYSYPYTYAAAYSPYYYLG